MNLVLHAVSLNGQPLSQAITGCFDAKGGTIGRSDSNTMSLPDPQRHISRLQAEVFARGDAFAVRDAGTANPVMLNDRVLARGEEGLLAQNDEIRIGGYVLKVRLEIHDDSIRTITQGRATVDAQVGVPAQAGDARGPLTSSLSARRGGADTSTNPFADLFGPGGDDIPPGGARTPDSRGAATSSSSSSRASARLPDDFDPFADLVPPVKASGAAAPESAPDAAHALQSIDPVGISGDGFEAAFGLDKGAPSGKQDLLGGFLADVQGRSGPDAMSDSFADLFGLSVSARPIPPVGSNHVSDLDVAFAPPRLGTVDGSRSDPQTCGPAPSRAASPRVAGDAADGLLDALFQGARVGSSTLATLDAEQMREIGRMLREAVEGTARLMTIRATAKKELRAELTTIQAQGNNPLKFCPDADAALNQLLRPALRGFMPASRAMQEAMHDLSGHAVGTIAGMQAALVGLLQRFEPDVLEKKLTSSSLLDSVLPMNRKARLWDLYVQHFSAIRADAESGFHDLFSSAFIQAYEAELDRLPHGPGR